MFPPSVFMTPSYKFLLYSTLLCKKIARAPGGHRRFMPTKLGGGDRIDPILLYRTFFSEILSCSKSV